MELTKNTSVDPVKMLGKNYIEAVNTKFPNTILDEEWSTPNQVTLTVKTNMFNGISHPAIGIARLDGTLEILREYGYEDYRERMD